MKNIKSHTNNNINTSYLAGVFLFLATLAVFLPVIHHQFINYDDQLYITENPMVISGLTLKGFIWAFTNISAGFWFPLTWLSHMLDCQIFGLNPGGHHLTGLLLHALNTVMLFYLFKKMTGSFLPSLLVACIFSFHPLNVEPVAWASSRKDLLSTFFWILTMRAYTGYVNQRSGKNYLLLLISFSMGLMAKPMLVTLPFVLILMDFWPLCRFGQEPKYIEDPIPPSLKDQGYFSVRKSITEKVPLFLLSIASISLTFIAEKKYGAVIPLQNLSISSRIADVFVSYIGYIYKFILPIGLSVHYPPYESLSLIRIIFSILLFMVITFLTVKYRHQQPYLLSGWLWFVITFIPVIGLVQIGNHSMADRYCYVPLIGLAVIFSWGLYNLISSLQIIKTGIFIICILIASLTVLTHFQLSYWQNDISLFEHAVKQNENDLTAHNNLAYALAQKGQEKEAIKHYFKALGIREIAYEVHFNLGKAFQSLKQYNRAIYHYKASLAIDPDYLNASLNLGTVYYSLKKFDEAAHCYMNVLRINPNNASAHNNLGVIMLQQNRIEKAIYYFNEALKIDPDNEMAIKNLQRIKKGNRPEK